MRVEATDALDWGRSSHITYHLIHNESSTMGDSIISSGKYSSSSSLSALFQIRSDTGEIYAKRSLDREQRDEYLLTVVAVDKGPSRLTASTRVRVRVLASHDADDNLRPVFEQSVYNVTIADKTDFVKRPLVLRVRAIDREILNRLQTTLQETKLN